MRLTELTDRMDDLSRTTWANLITARRLEMRYGEVTATEVNLLAIAQLIKIRTLDVELVATSQDEATTGVDFEIWLLTKRGRLFGYSIQAKIIEVRDGRFRYPKLGHRNSSGMQYDLLEKHAIDVGSHAVHVFYNGWELPDAGAPALPAGRDLKLFGCAAVETAFVREVRLATTRANRASVTASDYLPRAKPWSDLFRGPGSIAVTKGASGGGPSRGGKTEVVPPNGTGGGGNPTEPKAPAGGPVPLEPIELSPRGFDHLERQFAASVGHNYEFRRASQLPDYITQARGVQRRHLPKDSQLPRFAVIIQAG